MKLVMKTLQQLLMKKKTIVNLKKSIRIMKTQRSDTEKKKKKLIEGGKIKGIDKIIRQNA